VLVWLLVGVVVSFSLVVIVAAVVVATVVLGWSVAAVTTPHSHFAAACAHAEVAFSHSWNVARLVLLLLTVVWSVVVAVVVVAWVTVVCWSLMGFGHVGLHGVVRLRAVAASRVWLVVASRGTVLLRVLLLLIIVTLVAVIVAGRRPPSVVLSSATVLAWFVVVILHVGVSLRGLVGAAMASTVPTSVRLLHCTTSSSHGSSSSLLLLQVGVFIVSYWTMRHSTVGRRHSTIVILIVLAIIHILLVAATRSSCTSWWSHWRLLVIRSIILVVILSVSIVVWWSLVEMEVISASLGRCIAPLSWTTTLTISVLTASLSNLRFDVILRRFLSWRTTRWVWLSVIIVGLRWLTRWRSITVRSPASTTSQRLSSLRRSRDTLIDVDEWFLALGDAWLNI